MLTKIKNFFNKDESPEKNNGDAAKVPGDSVTNSESVKQNDTAEVKAEVGIEVKTDETTTEEKNQNTPEEIKEEVIKVLKTCYDPEIPVDVWELGLIYDIKVATNGDVLIIMTLTSPSCPVAGILPGEIQEKVKEHPMVHDCKVELTFDPPWGQAMMSEVAKLELGFM